MKNIERFKSLLECTSEKVWQESIFQLGKDYGFEQTLIAVVPNRPTSLSDAFLRSNYSAQWRTNYDSKQLLNIDPTVAHCATRSTPLIWEPAIFSGARQREMYEEASSYGLRSGITLPFHGAKGELGILCFVSDAKPNQQFYREAAHHLPYFSMLRDFAFESSLRFAKLESKEVVPVLTRRELECLKWCAAGKSTWDIAQILICSEAVVNFHFGNLRRKFNAINRSQVVVKAIRCGVLHL